MKFIVKSFVGFFILFIVIFLLDEIGLKNADVKFAIGLVVAIYVVVFKMKKIFNSKDSNAKHIANTNSSKNYGGKMKVYQNKVLYDQVVGIFAESSRIRAFQQLKKGTILFLEPDPYNEYDKNAVMVLDENGTQVGFLPRQQRKLLLTLSEYPNPLVKVQNLRSYYNDYKQRDEYSLTVELWLNFNQEFIKEYDKYFEFYNKAKIFYKENDFELALDTLRKSADISVNIQKKYKAIFANNRDTLSTYDIKVDLDKMTMCCIKLKQLKQCQKIYDEYYPLFLKNTNNSKTIIDRIQKRISKIRDL